MTHIKELKDLDLEGKKVLLRADLDVGEDLDKGDDTKLLTNKKTIEYLLEKKAKLILISHRGRPEGKISQVLSLSNVSERLQKLINIKINFIYDTTGVEAEETIGKMQPGEVVMLENLRFDDREEKNDEEFAERLASFADFYINEAFSSSAKEHASIVGIPKFLPHTFGYHFLEEVENLSKVLDNPKKPVVVIISGVKKDKLEYVEPFSKFADKILIAGRLPDLLELETYILSPQVPKEKLLVSRLLPDKEDITMHSIEDFEQEIERAGTIVISGPIGKFEDESHSQGTKRVFEAVANNNDAFKVGGGGDTEQAIEKFGLTDKFDWVSVGGGASLEFLAKGTLVGIEALK